MPARVLLQDFTGVPAVVDLAAMRDAMAELGGDPALINPLVPADLVIDHSVQVDRYRTPDAFAFNVEREYERNGERYELLRWAQTAFDGLRVVPPGTGIVHQVNLEYLASVVVAREDDDGNRSPSRHARRHRLAHHDGQRPGRARLRRGRHRGRGRAARPAALPAMPRVVGVRLFGELPSGSTATDLVLVVSHMLRSHGVVGSFVEFAGDGLASLALADRATIANMSPEYGATAALFPIDDETLAYLRLTGRAEDQVELVEATPRRTGCGASPAPGPTSTRRSSSTSRPSSRRSPARAGRRTRSACPAGRQPSTRPFPRRPRSARRWRRGGGRSAEINHGSVVIAAITSCTNTSNPTVMVGAGLLARNAVERGLSVPPTVKTSLAPGSRAVTEYYERPG
jgi:aconitate hydratase